MNNTCNGELYQKWHDEPFRNRLSDSMLLALISAERRDRRIWEIMNFDNARESFFSGNDPIANGQVMELSGHLCRRSLSALKDSLAGNHAPINDRDLHDVMCSNECLLNDSLRFIAMNISNCGCLDLSVQTGSGVFYKAEEGSDFCKENSGEYLCMDLDRCGKWQCDISDYGCKRIEYNQQEIPLKGFGNECSVASSRHCNMVLLSILVFLFSTNFMN